MATKSTRRRAGPGLLWHPKFKGECAEVAFLGKAMSLGFTVSKPFGDTSPFDFIVTMGARTWRVNVKSTWERQRNGEYRIRVGGCSTFGPRRYKKGEVDFVVGYVVLEDVWYVIPMGAIPTRFTINLRPHLGRKGGRFERYREAWGLLRRARRKGAKPTTETQRHREGLIHGNPRESAEARRRGGSESWSSEGSRDS